MSCQNDRGPKSYGSVVGVTDWAVPGRKRDSVGTGWTGQGLVYFQTGKTRLLFGAQLFSNFPFFPILLRGG